MNQAQFNKAYLQALNAADLVALRQLIAQFPQRTPKAPRFSEVSTLLESDATDAEKAEQCAAIARRNAVRDVRGTCVGVAVLVALGTFLAPALLGESARAEFYATNGVLLALYAILAGLAGQAPKFSAIAGFLLALVILVSNIALTGTAAGIVPVVLMSSALRSLPK